MGKHSRHVWELDTTNGPLRCIERPTVKRCYQQACRDKARYTYAPDALKKEADKAGYKGVKFVFDNTKHTSNGVTYPGIRRAASGEVPDGVLRKPEYAVQKAFEYLSDKHWHRYMFPFACFFYEKGTTGAAWKDWEAGLVCGRNEDYRINPYSVTSADVLYLCNTIGYLERYIYIIGIILWAKSYGCNLLRFAYRPGCNTNDVNFRRFVTLERHFYMFGSIHMHRRVLEANRQDVGGNWDEVMERLEWLETTCCQNFSVPKNTLASDFDNTIIRKTRTNLTMLAQVFPKCGKISDKPVLSR